VTFENGCSAYFDSQADIVWLSNPFGVDSAIHRGTDCAYRLYNYLRFWSENRTEQGVLNE